MRERLTARVLLLDPEDRILLMKGRLPGDPEAPAFWFTVGGGIEPGESVEAAAAREIVEETGFTDARIGPIVWYGEEAFSFHDAEPRHFKLHYILARTRGGEVSRAGWDALERQLVDDVRWWTRAQVAASHETIYPEGLAELLEDVLAGRFAHPPLVIRTLDGVSRPPPRVGSGDGDG